LVVGFVLGKVAAMRWLIDIVLLLCLGTIALYKKRKASLGHSLRPFDYRYHELLYSNGTGERYIEGWFLWNDNLYEWRVLMRR
jgi:hypothetical protein